MSTNIDQHTLPDITELERLANQFFKSNDELPAINAISPQANNWGIEHQEDIPFKTFGGGEGIVPPSAPGLGISPSAAQQSDALDLREPVTPPQHQSNDGGRIPVSVAGSGASPSAVQHGNNINIKEPQTGFPDNNIDHKKEENTFSPFDVLKEYLPFTADQHPLVDLQATLSGIHPQTTASQLPGIESKEPTDYYFLQDHITPAFEKNRYSTSSPFPWGFDANIVKKDFPILNERINGKPVIWLDNAATTQKPKQVIDRISYFYQHENSNIHRAAHALAARATDAYEEARKKVQVFLNAASANEIVFVRGTTEAINLVAKSWGEQYLEEGDEIIISHLEHHANIVPWQQLVAKKKLKLRVIPVDDDGQILLDEYAKLLNQKTKLVAFTQVSNALGTVTPAKTMIELAHSAGAKVLLDGAQSVSHMRADVQALKADWFVFSGHKIFGPTGIGVLYGKEELLNKTEPWQGGGNMIKDVTFEYTQFHNAPLRFEAGTGNIADAVGLGAAIDYVTRLGIENIQQYEHYLLLYAIERLKRVPGLKLIGTAKEKTSVLSFILDGYSNDEVGHALNQEGIAVRTGHHCAQPILRRFGLESTVRPSLAFYNTCADVDALVATLQRLKAVRK
jgi:cysteine desulfurase/selenocysteine lyase